MFKTILVPLDGSARSERALPVAANIARASGGKLVVMQAITSDDTFYFTPEILLSESIMTDEIKEAKHYLTRATASLEKEGIPLEKVVEFGSVAPVIYNLIESHHIDLIVMSSHGRTGISRWAIGSVTEKVARHSPIPIFIIRDSGPALTDSQSGTGLPLRILVPLDGSAYARTAITPAAHLITALAPPTQAALHMVRVVKPADGQRVGHYQRTLEDIVLKTKQSLQKTIENIRNGTENPELAHTDLQMTSSVALDFDIAQAIIHVAETGEDTTGVGIDGGCQIIAMATHGRSGLQHMAMGSITERVLHATQLPLLIVRPPQIGHKISHEKNLGEQKKHAATS